MAPPRQRREPSRLPRARVIAEDEARHAALAWQTLRWALSRDAALEAVLAEELARLAPLEEPPAQDDEETLAAHGVLEASEWVAAHSQALELLVLPLAKELCA